jgi:hypothetical protein
LRGSVGTGAIKACLQPAASSQSITRLDIPYDETRFVWQILSPRLTRLDFYERRDSVSTVERLTH